MPEYVSLKEANDNNEEKFCVLLPQKVMDIFSANNFPGVSVK
jgi:hypothetical protein